MMQTFINNLIPDNKRKDQRRRKTIVNHILSFLSQGKMQILIILKFHTSLNVTKTDRHHAAGMPSAEYQPEYSKNTTGTTSHMSTRQMHFQKFSCQNNHDRTNLIIIKRTKSSCILLKTKDNLHN